MNKYRLSKKFAERWMKIYGYAPDENAVNILALRGAIVQRFIKTTDQKGEIFKIPEIRIVTDKRLCLKIDLENKKIFDFMEV